MRKGKRGEENEKEGDREAKGNVEREVDKKGERDY